MCDCVGGCGCNCVGEGVCEWDSVDCCCKVCVLGRSEGEGGVCVIVGVNVIVWVGVDVIALVRECVGETALIAAVMYVWGEGGVCVGVTMWCECGCDCVCMWMCL